MASKVVPEYFPLPVDLLLPGSFCAAPLYRFSEGRYVEVFAGDKVITVEAVESLEDDDIDLLFVKRNVRLKFVNSITTQIFSKLNDPNLSVEDRVKATATAFQMTMERARAIGVTETTLELANVCIKSMHEIVEKIPALQKLLTVLFADTNGYRYQLCTLTSYIGGHIIKRMEWGSVEQQKKQTFVSFFAHIVLFKDEYLKYRSDEELDRSGLSEKEIVLIKNHALYGARMVSKLDKAPLGVDAIIKQHHGSKTGKSLSDLSLNISPLAIVYILAEEWAMNVLENHEKEVEEDAQTIMKKLKAKYSMPAFSKVFPALLELDL
jgi:hypothetical protein